MVGLPKSYIKKYGITKKAWSEFRKSKSRSKSKSKTTKIKTKTKKVGRRMGRNTQAKLFKIIRYGALVAPGINRAANINRIEHRPGRAITEGLLGYGGIKDGHFNWNHFTTFWTPFLAASAATYLIPKISGLIRRL